MSSPLTLKIAPPRDDAGSYDFLRREGLRHLERMAGALWTDYNAHDPGITILEQLCYAVTDLAYRTDYEIPDLLAEGGADPARGLYGPAQTLPSSPVTLTDLRKLVLDVEGVRNAWILPVETPDYPLHYHPGRDVLSLEAEPPASEPVELKGLYRVLIEKSDLDDRPDNEVRAEAVRRLHANRNLCEDFEEIRVLAPEPVTLTAGIEIGNVDDAEDVLLAVYQKVADYVAPSVRFHSLEEMLAAGKAMDEIFDGPLLEHGFIDSESLEGLQRRSALHTSDVLREIMSVPGVRAVRSISLSKGSKQEPWSLELDPSRTPKFEPQKSSIILQKEQLRVSVDVGKVLAAFTARRSRQTIRPAESGSGRPAAVAGRDRKVGRYHSIQHQFPAVYGIGEYGLPPSASARRQAQARQLKAYLLLFDQLLANAFAQLAHTGELFSFEGRGDRSYFARMIDDPRLGLDDVRREEPGDHRATLESLAEPGDGAALSLQRRNRFLNHLLARFAEEFTEYSMVLFGAMPKDRLEAKPSSEQAQEKLIQDKQAFLRRYPRISGGRGTAFNYLEPQGPENLSGLEERIALKLGLVPEDEERFYLVEHVLLRPMVGDDAQAVPILSAVGRSDPYSLQVSFVFPSWPARFREAGFKVFVERLLREETPAHIVPQCSWLGRQAMAGFEAAYADWVEKRRGYWLAESFRQGAGAGR